MTGDAVHHPHVAGRLGLLVRPLVLATAVAACLVAAPARAHTFPPVRNVVVQVEACEVVLLVGYRPGSGEPTEAIIGRAGSAPRGHGFGALRDVLGAFAMAPLAVAQGGVRLVPTSVQAKVGVEPGGGRPMVVMLVSYAAPGRGTLSVTTREPRTTRFSWQDQSAGRHGPGRVSIPGAPAQGRWFTGVASFLLELSGPCGTSPSRSASPSPP